jgi:hypothetical protein
LVAIVQETALHPAKQLLINPTIKNSVKILKKAKPVDHTSHLEATASGSTQHEDTASHGQSQQQVCVRQYSFCRRSHIVIFVNIII